MITAKNYAAQAAAAIRRTVPDVCRWIESAQHFALPDGGMVLDDDLRGIRGADIRLPFPCITVEYYVSEGGRATLPHQTERVSKRVVVAREHEDGGGFSCWWLGWWDEARAWLCTGVGLDIRNETVWQDGGLFGVNPIIHVLAKERLDANPSWLHQMMEDAMGEVRAVCELCEALSCKNVKTEPIERVLPGTNAKRRRKGKLPLYETYRLVVETPGITTASGRGIEDRTGPRQHLRRGHIRRLPSGNYWVNACVVGSAERGVIEKSYGVIPASTSLPDRGGAAKGAGVSSPSTNQEPARA